MNKNWYELKESERYNDISLDDFWNWWSDGNKDYMEIRIKADYNILKNYAIQNKVPFSSSGLYICSAWQLKTIVRDFASKHVMWFGVNPKRKLRNKNGFMSFSGKDIHIKEIKYVFVDIDRKNKDGKATQKDLMDADFLSEKIIEELSIAGFNKNYCKICSGNGVQLLFKLDVPIQIPQPKYDEKLDEYYEDEIFEKVKNTLKEGIGKALSMFSKKIVDKYEINAEADDKCYNLGRVAALHKTFNFKYETPTPRGILKIIKEGNNDGFSDYLLELYNNLDTQKNTNKELKNKVSIMITKDYEIQNTNLNKNKLIDLMLTYKFPDGGINNTLWYGIKLLLHSNGIDYTNPEYKELHRELKRLHNRTFPQNGLEPKYRGNDNGPFKKDDINIIPSMINKYLRLHKICKIDTGQCGYHKPIFEVSPKGKTLHIVVCNITPKVFYQEPKKEYNIDKIKDDPLKDLQQLAKEFYNIRQGNTIDEVYKIDKHNFNDIGKMLIANNLHDMLVDFFYMFREKWGNEITIYMMKHYMDDYLNYNRW